MIISVLNLKGGCGKTTSCVNLAAALAEAGARILMIDLDRPQFTLAKYRKAVPRARYENPDVRGLQALLQKDEFDHVIIDCPPRVGHEHPGGVMALLHSDLALIPVQAQEDALAGAYGIESVVEEIRPRNARIDLRVLLTMYRARWELCQSVRDQARRDFPGQVLGAIVPEHRDFPDASNVRQTVLKYAPASAGAKAYRKAAKEILDLWQSAPKDA